MGSFRLKLSRLLEIVGRQICEHLSCMSYIFHTLIGARWPIFNLLVFNRCVLGRLAPIWEYVTEFLSAIKSVKLSVARSAALSDNLFPWKFMWPGIQINYMSRPNWRAIWILMSYLQLLLYEDLTNGAIRGFENGLELNIGNATFC